MGQKNIFEFGGVEGTCDLLQIQGRETKANTCTETARASKQTRATPGSPHNTKFSAHHRQNPFSKKHDIEFKLYCQLLQMTACLCNSLEQNYTTITTEITKKKSDHGSTHYVFQPFKNKLRICSFLLKTAQGKEHTQTYNKQGNY